MEPKFQSSFIPKGPVAGASASSMASPKNKSLFGVISMSIFALAVAGSLGIFGYNFYLGYRISRMGQDIETARASIQPEVIREITRMDARLITAQKLLNNHLIVSPIFEFLEASTIQAVRFTEFDYETTDKGLELKVLGEARGYSAVALQSEEFNKSGHFKDPVFSDLHLDNEGNVVFSFNALVAPELLSYKKLVEGRIPASFTETPAPAESIATSTPATATSTPPAGVSATSTPVSASTSTSTPTAPVGGATTTPSSSGFSPFGSGSN